MRPHINRRRLPTLHLPCGEASMACEREGRNQLQQHAGQPLSVSRQSAVALTLLAHVPACPLRVQGVPSGALVPLHEPLAHASLTVHALPASGAQGGGAHVVQCGAAGGGQALPASNVPQPSKMQPPHHRRRPRRWLFGWPCTGQTGGRRPGCGTAPPGMSSRCQRTGPPCTWLP